MTGNGVAAEFVLYHPWPPVDHRTLGEWVKTMLLFFEGVAILAPPDKAERLLGQDEETLGPLADQALFRTLDPGTLIGEREADAILEFLFSMATGLEEDRWVWSRGDGYRISPGIDHDIATALIDGGLVYRGRSLLGYGDNSVRSTAAMLWDVLRRHNVATAPDDEGTIRMHSAFWALYQAFLAHSVYDAGLEIGLSLRPATDHVAQINTQNALLAVPGHPSAGQVVSFDLQQVTLDLSRFELSEVLQFRAEHGTEYRQYARDLRTFAVLASQARGEERARLMRDRHDALADAAADLRRTSRGWWRRAAASVGVGISGAAWSASSGDWPAAIVSVLGGVVGVGEKPTMDNAFSYLLHAENTFSGR